MKLKALLFAVPLCALTVILTGCGDMDSSEGNQTTVPSANQSDMPGAKDSTDPVSRETDELPDTIFDTENSTAATADTTAPTTTAPTTTAPTTTAATTTAPVTQPPMPPESK